MERVAGDLPAGVTLARRDHEILLVFGATMIINTGSMVAWLFPKQFVDRRFPSDPVLWYAALGILSFFARQNVPLTWRNEWTVIRTSLVVRRFTQITLTPRVTVKVIPERAARRRCR